MRIKLDDGFVIETKDHKYMGADVDRHDNVRVFVRRDGRKARIRDWSSVEAFMAEYRVLLSGADEPVPAKRAAPHDSLRWLVERYYGSSAFGQLDETTRKDRRRILDTLSEKYGHKQFRKIETQHIAALRDEKFNAGSPESANSLVKALRGLFKWATDTEVGLAELNPASGVKRINSGSQGHHTWTVEEVYQFEELHPIGTKARLAMALMLYTGTRISDAVRLGPQMERDGVDEDGNPVRRLHFTEWKDRKRKPKHRAIPIVPELRAIIDATPSGHLNYVVSNLGKPYSSAHVFGKWFKRQCKAAGLPHCSAHGLRKAGATIAANNGATAHALMAMYGWTTLSQAEGYTREVDNMRLADEHMHRVVPEQKMDEHVPPSEAVSSSGTIRGKKS